MARATPPAARCQTVTIAAGPGDALRRMPSTTWVCHARKRDPRIPLRAPDIDAGTRATRAAIRAPGSLLRPGARRAAAGDGKYRSARNRPDSRSTCLLWPRSAPAPPSRPVSPDRPACTSSPRRRPTPGRSEERPGERATTAKMAGAACQGWVMGLTPVEGLRRKDDLPGGGPAGQLAVRLRGFGQREVVLHAQVELAGLDPSEHSAGPLFQLFTIGSVVA